MLLVLSVEIQLKCIESVRNTGLDTCTCEEHVSVSTHIVRFSLTAVLFVVEFSISVGYGKFGVCLLCRAQKTPQPETPEPTPTVSVLSTVRSGSIKAWKEEQDRLQQEREEEERLGAETAKSPTRGRGVCCSLTGLATSFGN